MRGFPDLLLKLTLVPPLICLLGPSSALALQDRQRELDQAVIYDIASIKSSRSKPAVSEFKSLDLLNDVSQEIHHNDQDERVLAITLPPFAITSQESEVESILDRAISTHAANLLPASTNDEQGPVDIAQITEADLPSQPSKATPATHSSPAEGRNPAQQAQNPIANLISVPFQNNLNVGVGPFDETQYVLNIQPVIPVELSDDWLLISRIITPIISQPTVELNSTTGTLKSSGSEFGLGDINPSFFWEGFTTLSGQPMGRNGRSDFK